MTSAFVDPPQTPSKEPLKKPLKVLGRRQLFNLRLCETHDVNFFQALQLLGLRV